MALLRGNSYVDGDLIVEGALQVGRLVVTKGAFPYLSSSNASNTSHLVQFSDRVGGIIFAPVRISSTGFTDSEIESELLSNHKNSTSPEKDITELLKNLNYILLETQVDKVRVINTKIKLSKPYTWEFDVPSKEEEKKES